MSVVGKEISFTYDYYEKNNSALKNVSFEIEKVRLFPVRYRKESA